MMNNYFRYHCGSAREFFYDDKDASEATQSMTCQWDKSWTPSPVLGTCDWVACLKPPSPPASAHIRYTDWFGAPIQFGEQVKFVCERGYFFEDDFHQTEVLFTCQDGTNPDFKDSRGFFDIPEQEDDWPKCSMAPTCPKPPDVPEEGVREYLPIPIPQVTEKQCVLDGDDLNLKCPFFLQIYVKNLTYGRDRLTEKNLCDGEQKDNFAPDNSCYDDNVHHSITTLLRHNCNGQYECSQTIPTEVLTGCDGMRRELKVEHICSKLIFSNFYFLMIYFQSIAMIGNLTFKKQIVWICL